MKKLLLLFLLITSLSFSEDFELAQKTFWLTDESRIEHYTPNFNSGEKVRISYTIYYKNSPTKKNRPLVIYNHGGGGYSDENLNLFYELTKKDFIVLSIAHKYISGIFLEEDRTKVGQGLPNVLTGLYTSSYTDVFYKNTLLALEHFEEINSTQLDNLADTSFYIATGFSIGGATSGFILNNDSRCIGAINFDGVNHGRKSDFTYNKPYLMYISETLPFNERPDFIAIKKTNPNNVNYIVFKNTDHLHFILKDPKEDEFSKVVIDSSIDFISKVFKNEAYKENLAKLDNDETIFFDRVPEDPKDNSGIIILAILGIGVLGFGIKKFKK